jgi:site-specific recombinase XerD
VQKKINTDLNDPNWGSDEGDAGDYSKMIIQFIDIECTNVKIARFLAWLAHTAEATERSNYELLNQFDLSEEDLRDGGSAKKAIELKREPLVKHINTPTDDWYRIPFLIDRNERPLRAANAWLRHICKRGSPKTWRTYAYALFDYFQYLEWKKIDWRAANDLTLTNYRIEQEISDSKHKAAHNGRLTLSPNTIQLRLITAARFYEYAALYGHIAKNPLTQEIKKTRRPLNVNFLGHLQKTVARQVPIIAYARVPSPAKPKWLPHEAVWTWLSSIINERDKLIAKLLYQTGMRREEIILWRVNNIPTTDVLNKAPEPRWIEFPIRGKGGTSRPIRISTKNFLLLRIWIDFERVRILKRLGMTGDRDHGFVWISSRNGNPLQPLSLNRVFRGISKKCNIWIAPHMLRHSFAVHKLSDLYRAKVPQPLKVLQGLLGHRSIVTTITFYGHISPEDEALEAQSNADFLDALSQKGNDVN